ncbi:MAG TPA: biotin/lipoyl-containing protein, partial [Planctomicrobium sp.]|nr:biotin/lipoyl-containing protein [Planctomicrobium sp.]
MSVEFKLPNIGEGVNEADIADILVSEGDVIEANQTVMELETEKAVFELPCSDGGTIEKIHVKPGQTVQVGNLLMTLSGGKKGSDKKEPEKKESEKSEKAEEKPAAKPEKAKEDAPAEEPETELVGGTIEFELPPLGEGVSSADIAEILVSEGDVVEANASVMELETEKAVVELPLPFAGKIKKIHVKSGDSVNVGSVVLTVETSSKVGKSESKPAPKETAAKEEKKESAP